jgi:thymidylate kinase
MQEHLLTPLLAEHDVVVSDGWCYKFLARHRVHAPEQATRTQVVMQTVRQADLVLFLDVSPEECWSRRTEFRPSELGAHGHVEGASARDKFIAYQRRVYSEFRAMAATTDFWRIIPAAQKTPEDLIASMVEEVLRVP